MTWLLLSTNTASGDRIPSAADVFHLDNSTVQHTQLARGSKGLTGWTVVKITVMCALMKLFGLIRRNHQVAGIAIHSHPKP
ncbi:hypothetical protein PGT21_020976 [Puccinia graminis f. sp. tritici]|uniref:Uncharacterized protein n=1 Tax=Puccinia graminis f. sp. tritici TaxID=56615 RepID=A0A5B0N6S7_PUCGR|nr:hypothetical protein PGTUg99_011693 [Puccinia graminis f. sp. tritici]KAA1084204.1 hypothetical protein PGT21_020976 [Puccinia graminis f. sp. tritici]